MNDFLHTLASTPEFRELLTINTPMDLCGIAFFLIMVYALVGGTYSMLRNQVKYVAHAVTHREAPAMSECHVYTRSLINGTAPELIKLRATKDRARQREILAGIINTLEVQDSSPVARELVKSLRRRF